jgi:hypothetical protein
LARNVPQHWKQHTGLNNWYSVSYPPAWELETKDGTVALTAPEGGGVLTLSGFWLDGPQSAVESILDLDRLFPRRRHVQPLKAIETGEQCVGFQGQAVIGGDSRWWRRVFRTEHWQHWRAWCLRRGPVYVLAQYLQTEKIDHESATLAAMIVGSIALTDQPACPPEAFAERVLELARTRFPLLNCEAAPDFQIKFGDSKVNLLNFYRTYVTSPGQFESIVLPALTTVVQVQGWGKEQTEPALADVRERIMPMLYPQNLWKEQIPNSVGMPWVGGLVVLYVVDESHAYWYIREDLLETWGLPPDDLHEIALANLNRYFDEAPMEFTVAGEEDGPRLLIPARPDAYNTSRLLSEPFHEKLRGVLGGEFAVGTPSRDFFVAVSLDSSETVEHVRKKVEDDFQQMDHPLSDRLLLVTHDGVTEYAPWV